MSETQHRVQAFRKARANPGGRPRTSANSKTRRCTINIAVTEEEKALFTEQAGHEPLAAWCRRVLLEVCEKVGKK